VALFAALAALPLLHEARADAAPGVHIIIIIKGVAFDPKDLTIKRGERVKWINQDPFPHTVTARGAFDSHSIPAGASWTHAARRPGVYAYSCTLHPNMQGTLRVQ
jgi:plastocyanin